MLTTDGDTTTAPLDRVLAGLREITTSEAGEAGVIPVGPPRFARGPEPLPEALTDSALADWVILSRVRAGAVVRFAGRYFDGNRLFCNQHPLSELYIDALAAIGVVTLRHHEHGPLEVVLLTDAGRERLDELRALCGRRQPATP